MKNFFSENLYKLDENVEEIIKTKTQEIINDQNSKYKDYPYYYKIGKFVNSYLEYDLSYHGANKSALEIYNEKKGVCEHFIILLNTMFNSIGIKTLTIFWWDLDKETFADTSTIGHA